MIVRQRGGGSKLALLAGLASLLVVSVGAVPRSLPFPRVEPLTKGWLLIARRGLPDPNFAESVVLLVDVGASGAVGFVLNRPSPMGVNELFPSVDALHGRRDPVFLGGPVARRRVALLVRSEEPPPNAHPVVDDVYLSLDLSVLTSVAAEPHTAFRVYVGYAGWGPGQLDREIAQGVWRVAQADADLVFDRPPAELWPTLIRESEGTVTRLRGTDQREGTG